MCHVLIFLLGICIQNHAARGIFAYNDKFIFIYNYKELLSG